MEDDFLLPKGWKMIPVKAGGWIQNFDYVIYPSSTASSYYATETPSGKGWLVRRHRDYRWCFADENMKILEEYPSLRVAITVIRLTDTTPAQE